MVDLRAFKDMDFSKWGGDNNVHVQTVREVIWSPLCIEFPLAVKYARANRTIDGIEGFVPEPADEPFSELQIPDAAPAPFIPKIEVVVVKNEVPVERMIVGTEIKIGDKTIRTARTQLVVVMRLIR